MSLTQPHPQQFVHTGSLILTTDGEIWYTCNDDEPVRWYDSLPALFAVFTQTRFTLPEHFSVRIRRTCGACGSWYLTDRSCGCFDNNCE